jgi:alpha-L-rhamnosidase
MSVTWQAAMITPDRDLGSAPLLRALFAVEDGHGEVVRATLHASARGVFEAVLGGRPVADDVLSPGWSAYEWRLRYRTYDVTALLGVGPQVLGLRLGNGWYRGRLGWSGGRALYGSELAALAQLEIVFTDGHVQVIGTDDTWRAGPSEVLADDLYDGQTIDARRCDGTWLQHGAEPAGWTGVRVVDDDLHTLVPAIGPPVRRQETLAPRSVWASPSGRTLVDFGQNLVGWVRCTVRGERGATITVRYAEVIEGDELGTRPLRTARATDTFVLSGGRDTFEPTFTFHGFRYAEVDGWPGELSADDLEAVVVHSELARTGTFACSSPLVNRLHENVVWSMRGNFLDVPTDCPQRDERLGWTGDLAVFAPTAAYLYDVRGFLADWAADVAAEQAAADGRVPFVVPDVLKYVAPPRDFPPVAVWSDVAAWLPWALWQAYGDRDLLGRHLPMMLAHVRHVAPLLSDKGVWEGSFQFGDWLDPDAPPDRPAAAKADPSVVATAAFYRSVRMTADAAAAVGRDVDAAEMTELAERLRSAFTEHYVEADGSVRSDCQTVYALAICFGLLDDDAATVAGRRLAALVEAADLRIATGFAGTPYVLDALTRTGRVDLAYRMLLQPENPGWIYPITMGATSIWERWDSMLPDGSINPGQMTSFNHYALGAVADWLHRVVAGIAPLAPGYAKVLVAPVPGPGITSASGALATPHGRVATSWTLDGSLLTVDVTVPEGATAVLRLPGSDDRELAAGEHRVIRPIGP